MKEWQILTAVKDIGIWFFHNHCVDRIFFRSAVTADKRYVLWSAGHGPSLKIYGDNENEA
jgi:hypothetical protein